MEPTTTTTSAFSQVLGFFFALVTGYAFLKGVDYLWDRFVVNHDDEEAARELNLRVLNALDPNNKEGSLNTILDTVQAGTGAIKELKKQLSSEEYRTLIAADVAKAVIENLPEVSSPEEFAEMLNNKIAASLATATETISKNLKDEISSLKTEVAGMFQGLQPLPKINISKDGGSRKQPSTEERRAAQMKAAVEEKTEELASA